MPRRRHPSISWWLGRTVFAVTTDLPEMVINPAAAGFDGDVLAPVPVTDAARRVLAFCTEPPMTTPRSDRGVRDSSDRLRTVLGLALNERFGFVSPATREVD